MIFVELRIIFLLKLFLKEDILDKLQIFGLQVLYCINFLQERFHLKVLMIKFYIEKYAEDNIIETYK